MEGKESKSSGLFRALSWAFHSITYISLISVVYMTVLFFQKGIAPFSSNSMVGIARCFFLSCGMLNWDYTPLSSTQTKVVTFLLFPFTHEGVIDCLSYITLNVLCEVLLLTEFHYTEVHLLGSFLYTQLCMLCSSYLLFPSCTISGFRSWSLVLQINVIIAYVIRMCCSTSKQKLTLTLICLIGSLVVDIILALFLYVYSIAVDIAGICIGCVFSLSFFPWGQFPQLLPFLYNPIGSRCKWLTVPVLIGFLLLFLLGVTTIIVCSLHVS